LVAVLTSATAEPTSEQDTIKEMKHMSTSSLWVQQGKPIEGNSSHYEHVLSGGWTWRFFRRDKSKGSEFKSVSAESQSWILW